MLRYDISCSSYILQCHVAMLQTIRYTIPYDIMPYDILHEIQHILHIVHCKATCAFAQTFCVSAEGGNYFSEGPLAFYDIFVRHAFGSFRDLLQEVTYSPLMGMYLTAKDNQAKDISGQTPNENYASPLLVLNNSWGT